MPYLFSGSPDHWASYERTLTVLPELNGRMGPDVQHLILEMLSLAMAIALTALTMRLWRRHRDRTSTGWSGTSTRQSRTGVRQSRTSVV